MASIQSNIGEVTGNIDEKIKKLGDKEYIPRTLSFDLIDLMTKRIHIDGEAADGSQIGTYSSEYMRLRTGNYPMDGRAYLSGDLKGENRTIGKYTKGPKKGQTRTSYNRSADSKIIVSLTRQLENDWNVIATDDGYGIGFLNSHNFDKARWVEAIKGKKIFSLSATEQQYVNDTVDQLVKDVIA